MIRLLETVISRVKAMFTLDAMLDLEQQFLTRQAERKAELIRSADRYEREGMAAIADDLRQQAKNLSEQRPLQIVAPFLGNDFAPPPDKRPIGQVREPRTRPERSGPPLLTAASSRKKGK